MQFCVQTLIYCGILAKTLNVTRFLPEIRGFRDSCSNCSENCGIEFRKMFVFFGYEMLQICRIVLV